MHLLCFHHGKGVAVPATQTVYSASFVGNRIRPIDEEFGSDLKQVY